MIPSLRATLPAGAALLLLGLAPAAAAQEPEPPAPVPPLQDLTPQIVRDEGCALTRLVEQDRPSAEAVGAAVNALYPPRGRPETQGTFDWLLWPRANAPGDRPDSEPAGEKPVAVLFDGRDVVEGDRLYEAEVLRISVLVPQPDSVGLQLAAARAGTAVREEASLLARGFPALLAEILALVPGRVLEALPCGPFAVFTHVTPIGFPDATVVARVEAETGPLGDLGSALAEAFQPVRADVEARYLGYTGLHAVLGAIEQALRGPACAGGPAEGCLLAARQAAVDAALALEPTAEHTIRALREGTGIALDWLSQRAGSRRLAAARTFRVIRRPWIGFSVGGLLTQQAGDKLEFEVKDGLVVADGVEKDGFKSLVLVDLYLRPVDISHPAPGFLPHVSLGFAVGDELEPGLFLASTLPYTGGRLAPFAGAILRRETEDATAGAGGEPALDEDRRVRWVTGIKVGLPLLP